MEINEKTIIDLKNAILKVIKNSHANKFEKVYACHSAVVEVEEIDKHWESFLEESLNEIILDKYND
jgi:hypothetical protein